MIMIHCTSKIVLQGVTVLKKQFTKPIWKRCFTFALAAALVVQMIATPSLTAFAADDAAATISASDLKPEETPAVEEKTADETPAVEEKTVDETPAVEEAAEEVGAPALKVVPAVEEEPETADAVTYLDADGSEQSVSDYTVMTSSTTQLTTGWYIVNANLTISSRIVVQQDADVHLILCDDKTLTAKAGISVTSSNNGKLTIYAQSTGSSMGVLSATTQKKKNYAPIGGYGNKTETSHAGTITINGGKITATTQSAKCVAAIGGSTKGGAGNITINGGIVEAIVTDTANSPHSALGFGFNGNAQNGTVTINGGKVTVTGPTSGSKSYGIGAKSVTITGGQVSATGNANGIIATDGQISLSHTHPTDSIYASSYSPNPTLNSDFVLEGTETPATSTNAGGHTIVPAPVNYTVTFYNTDGSVIKTESVREGNRPTSFPDESEVTDVLGYSFAGAWKDKTTGEMFEDDDVITSDKELIPDMKLIHYLISYDLDGGTVEGNPENYNIESETFTLVNPTKEGYDFAGWSGTDIEGTSMEVTIAQGSTGERAYIAHWTEAEYTVTFDTDEGSELKVLVIQSGEGESEQIGETYVNSGDKVKYGTVLDVTATAKIGYRLTETPEDPITVTANTVIKVRSEKRTYSLTVSHENGAEPTISCNNCQLDAIPYGTAVELTAGEANEGYEFIGFYRTNGVLLSANASFTFAMTANTTIEARYQMASGHIVTFMSNGQVYKSDAYETFTENDMPVAPSAVYGYEFKEWSMNAEQINDALQNGNVTVEAVFIPVQETFTVTIYNGESEEPEEVNCTEGKVITRKATAVNGKNFAYWTLDDAIISYNPTVSYFATSSGELRAVYTTETVEALATATVRFAKFNIESKKLSINVYLTLPNDRCTIVKAGLVAAAADGYFDPETQELTDDTADYAKSLSSAVGKSAPVNYTWNKSNVSQGDKWFVRARLIYKDENGSEQVVYGPMITVIAGTDYDYAEKGTATIKDLYYNETTKKATFIAYLTVPENGVIVKAGLVASSTANFDPETALLTSSNADYVKSLSAAVGKSAPVNYTWNKGNVESGDEWYARAWLVYDLDGVRHTVYGDLELLKTAK